VIISIQFPYKKLSNGLNLPKLDVMTTQYQGDYFYMMKSFNINKLDPELTAQKFNDPILAKQFRFDLTMRARGGIFIYLVIWLITSFWSDIIQTNPFSFYLNTLIIFIITVMRIVHYALYTFRNLRTQRMHSWLVFLILVGALHWGVLSAWVVFVSSIESLHYLYLMIISAFALGGTTILSISSTIRKLYPLFIFLPPLIAGLIFGDKDIYLFAILIIISLMYIFEATLFSHHDYWNAIINYKEADVRARQMKELSITDQLTGLHNRMYFNNRLGKEWKRCSRLKSSLSIMLIDLDHFKLINDNFGHIAGDECLKMVGEVLRTEIKRDSDVTARYGGEEFVVILPNTNLALSCKIAEKLIKKIAEIELTWESKKIFFTCSIGLASMVPDKSMNSEQLLKAADETMYQAKEQGRNQYCVFKNSATFSDIEENQPV
jgi:diguanylate cyclase (GGDEF)-like protein